MLANGQLNNLLVQGSQVTETAAYPVIPLCVGQHGYLAFSETAMKSMNASPGCNMSHNR